MSETKKVWFITGANRGLGRAFVEAALERGDQVAATSRDLASLKDLSEKYSNLVLPIKLDITDREGVREAIQQATQQFGRIVYILVNNAGFGTFGAVEEISEGQLRRQFEVNVFGTFHVTQAVLPTMREQGSGHILQISSVSGVVTFPYQGAYASSKWAVEGFDRGAGPGGSRIRHQGDAGRTWPIHNRPTRRFFLRMPNHSHSTKGCGTGCSKWKAR